MTTLQVGQIVSDTEAEGPGRRFAVWVQGCPLRCRDCCNTHMLPFRGGVAHDAARLAEQVLHAPVEGVTLLGGEPTAQPEAVAEICARVQDGGKSTMVFSGYTLAELRSRQDPAINALLAACDLLVDGPYERERPETKRRWIGSCNQVMHFLTDRYSPDDPQFMARNSVELRLSAGALVVNGWPALGRQLRVRSR